MAKAMLLLGLVSLAFCTMQNNAGKKQEERTLVPHSTGRRVELNEENWFVRSEQMAKTRYQITPQTGESCNLY